MPLHRSRVTRQGRITIPSEIRRKLAIGPGSVLEWELEGDRVIVRKVRPYSFEDIHRAIFARQPRRRTLAELKEGLRKHARGRADRLKCRIHLPAVPRFDSSLPPFPPPSLRV